MQTNDFPRCCTGKILQGFGQDGQRPEPTRSVDEIKTYVQAQMRLHSAMGFFTATTNHRQENAIQALKELGFSSTRWMTSKYHKDTKTKLWWKAVNPPVLKKVL